MVDIKGASADYDSDLSSGSQERTTFRDPQAKKIPTPLTYMFLPIISPHIPFFRIRFVGLIIHPD